MSRDTNRRERIHRVDFTKKLIFKINEKCGTPTFSSFTPLGQGHIMWDPARIDLAECSRRSLSELHKRPLRQDAASARPPAMAATRLEPSRRQNLPTSVPPSFRAPRHVLLPRSSESSPHRVLVPGPSSPADSRPTTTKRRSRTSYHRPSSSSPPVRLTALRRLLGTSERRVRVRTLLLRMSFRHCQVKAL
jgi:hypothetical protein